MKFSMKKPSPVFIIPTVVFIVYFIFGILIYKNYGTFWDEGIERYSGIVNTKEILSHINNDLPEKIFGKRINDNIPLVQNYRGRYYGVALQFPQLLLDYFIRDKQQMWETRHLFMFVLFFTSVVFFFFAIRRIFDSWILALIGSLFLILSPRFFAESFYNIKDIGFFSTFTIAFYFLIRFIEKPSIKNTILFGLFVAFSSAVRIIGLSLIPFGAAFIFISFLKKRISLSKLILICSVFMVSILTFITLFYPASWRDPIKYFLGVIGQMSNYPWDGEILFMGKIYMAHNLPWYYLPVWIGVTTPIPILIFMLLGIMFPFFKLLFPKKIELNSVLIFSWIFAIIMFFGMILYVIIKKPTLYDGWRHFYFLYLPILILAVFGVESVYKIVENYIKGNLNIWKVLFYSVLGFIFLPSLIFIFMAHPYQNVYFNGLAGKKAFYLFEKDYWCLSFSESLKKLAAMDTSDKIYVLNTGPIEQCSEMLKKSDRDRFVFTRDVNQARYFFNNFRAVPYKPEVAHELFNIKVIGQKIISVQKL